MPDTTFGRRVSRIGANSRPELCGRLSPRSACPRSRPRAVAHVIVVSTHLDDAVLSCWTVVDSPHEVAVMTVYTGLPAADSSTRLSERIKENEAAFTLAGAAIVNLNVALNRT